MPYAPALSNGSPVPTYQSISSREIGRIVTAVTRWPTTCRTGELPSTSTTAKPLYTWCVRPCSRSSMAIASSGSAGFPSTSLSKTTMVSAPITSALSLDRATSRALVSASRSTSSAGSAPVTPDSSTSPGWTEKAMPRRLRSSRRRGEREANTNSGCTVHLHLTLDQLQ